MHPQPRPTVSLTLIARDAAGTLGRCLDSVRGLFDEIVVVDTGSVDATVDVAREHGARVVQIEWPGSFAAARNVSLAEASGGWIAWLDADEWLDPDDRERLRRLLAGLDDAPRVYFMEQASAMGEARLAVVQPRLFRRLPDVRWAYRVHEQILPACLARGDRPTATDIVIRHSGYESPAQAEAKRLRNLLLLRDEQRERPDDPWVLLQLARSLTEHEPAEAEALLTRAGQHLSPSDPLERPILSTFARLARSHTPDPSRLAQLRGLLDRFPNDSELLFTVGTLSYQQGDLDGAERAFTRLVAQPADPEESFATVDRALRGHQARHNLAVIQLRQGRHAEAEAHWRAVVVEHPASTDAWLGLAEILLGQHRWDELPSILDRLQTAPDDRRREARLLAARVDLERGAYEPAIAQLLDLLADAPDDLALRLLLARAYLLDGHDLDAAEAALREVLRLDPDHPQARRCLDALRDTDDDSEPEESEEFR